ncbi:stage VI sporulation protein D [Niallia sp. 03133]|uniref:stage VI sporulation protein D n=1 Tax=Niallia sp. 03133 TaxID=3458060 RepID=UPI0040441847
MSQENSSTLRFSLEESVWFQRGQEVADLLSISLDPNITIQENDQYITIQGSLELTGEYTRSPDNHWGEEEVFHAPKLIHSVMEREEGICEFLHHFPVDITIPIARIASLDDIEVEIESFDYVFPEESCLNLTADLSIAGLTNEEQSDGNKQELEEEAIELVYKEQEIEEPEELEFAFRGQEDTDVFEENFYEEKPVELMVSPFQTISPLLEEERSSDEDTEDVADLYKPFEAEAKKSAAIEDEMESKVVPFFSESQQDEEAIPIYKVNAEDRDMKVALFRNEKEEVYSAEDVYQKPPQESSELTVEDVSYEQEEEEEESSESSSNNQKGAKKKKGIFNKTKSLTFTEFFARKEEETHTKIKICIVQHGETLEKLSERYNIQVHSILKENRMEANQDIYEGQVLYIPVKYAEK